MFSLQTGTQTALVALALVPVLFFGALAIGRWLKRKQGVRLGFFYVIFCAVIAVEIPLSLFGPAMLSAQKKAPGAAPAAAGNPSDVRLQEINRQLLELEARLKTTREQFAAPVGTAPTAAQPPSPTAPVAHPAPGPVAGFEFPLQSVMRHLNAAAAILGTFLLMALVRRYFWELWFERQQKSPAPKFLSQLLSLLIFLGTLMLVMSVDYGKDLTAFVFGSTVVVGIVGFAMQDLLGNIISGIALEIGKPFRIGDWLFIDNQYAEVIEVNWRSTRLRTNDDIQLDLPNKTVAGAILTNLSHPTRQHAARVRVGFEYEVPPNAVKEALFKAAARAHGVLPTPPPKVYLRDYGDSAAIYEIKFWIDNQAMFNEICDAVRTNIWYEAHRRGFRFPFPTRTLHLEKKAPARPLENLQAALLSLRKQPFLKCLDETELQKVLSHARPLRFGAGEKVIEQGESGDSMFFLSRGEAEVFVRPAEARHDTRIASLKQGDCFGEMSLLTGEPRSATVVAKRDCEVWEIQQPVMAEVLQNNETLVQKLGEVLAQRRLEIEGVLAANLNRGELSVRQREYTQSFLDKLYSVFEL